MTRPDFGTGKPIVVTYEWTIIVVRWDYCGRRQISRTPSTIVAATQTEVTAKMRTAFEAEYDEFRKFWSHSWELVSMRELAGILAEIGDGQ